MRSAEENRVSTCDFADRIANTCLAEYKKRCPSFADYKQTVVAGIVIQSPDRQLHIVGLGVGTKVPNVTNYMSKGYNESSSTPAARFQYHELVRDCHAEVLARRSFLRFLHNYLDTNIDNNPRSYNYLYQSPMFEGSSESGLLRLSHGYSLHLYTSSQPCGNATIKKWAKSKSPVHFNIAPDEYPVELHSHLPFHVTARSEGQVALLVKKNNNIVTISDPISSSSSSVILNTTQTETDNQRNDLATSTSIALSQQAITVVVPEGLATVNSQLGCVMSCSDKIAKWNALGLQGSLLSARFEPLYLSTITVGRKFSQVHCERALCCRVSGFRYPVLYLSTTHGRRPVKVPKTHDRVADTSHSTKTTMNPTSTTSESSSGANSCSNKIQYYTHHPAMLCTSVKLDTGVIYTAPATATATATTEDLGSTVTICGAQFTENRCLAWWPGCEFDLRVLTEQVSSSYSYSEVTLRCPTVLILDGNSGFVDTSQFQCSHPEVDVLLHGKIASPISSSIFLSVHRSRGDGNNDSVSGNILDSDSQSQIDSYNSYKTVKQTLIEKSEGSRVYSLTRQLLLTDKSLFAGWIDKHQHFDNMLQVK